MIPISCTQVEVHVFRRRGKRLETLLIRRSPERSLAGVWQPVTGGIERGESAIQAAVREVREETGLRPLRWWALEHMATFYDVAADHMRVVPVFAAEVAWTDPVHLSHEHDRYAYVPLAEAWERVLWSTQRSALEALADEVLSGSAGGSAREITTRIAALLAPTASALSRTATSRSRTRTPSSRTAPTRARTATSRSRTRTASSRTAPARARTATSRSRTRTASARSRATTTLTRTSRAARPRVTRTTPRRADVRRAR